MFSNFWLILNNHRKTHMLWFNNNNNNNDNNIADKTKKEQYEYILNNSDLISDLIEWVIWSIL